jgi:ABC-type lipoprotein release transport system permease subunit
LIGLTRFISNLHYGVGANDPVTVAAAVMVLAAMSQAACYLPAHRAMRTDPVAALREQ